MVPKSGGRVRPGFSMERKERKFEFKHYEVLDKMSCVDGLEELRTDRPQSIETQPNLNIKRPKNRSAVGENMLQTWKSGNCCDASLRSQNWDLEAELWSNLKQRNFIARRLFFLEIKSWNGSASSRSQNWDLDAELWNKLKRPKILARKLFFLEIKV